MFLFFASCRLSSGKYPVSPKIIDFLSGYFFPVAFQDGPSSGFGGRQELGFIL